MSSEVAEQLAEVLAVKQVIVLPIVNISIMYFLYGFYVLLFGSYVVCLRSNQRVNGRNTNETGNLHLYLAAALFVLSTMFVADYTLGLVYQSILLFNTVSTGNIEPLLEYASQNIEKTVVSALQGYISVLLNITADCMLIHRCHLVWTRNHEGRSRVAWPLIVASVITNALGLASTTLSTIGINADNTDPNRVLYTIGDTAALAYYISSAIVNSTVTILTAYRIWSMNREISAGGCHLSDTLYRSLSKIILESGIIYPICILAQLTVINTAARDAVPYSLVPLSAGIAPTLALVRSKISAKEAESFQEIGSRLRFATVPVPTRGKANSIGTLSIPSLQLNVTSLMPELQDDEKDQVV